MFNELVVNGYPVGYRIVDGKLYLLADDVGGYFGYARSKGTGRCAALYHEIGVGLCKPSVYLSVGGFKKMFYPYSAMSRFVQLMMGHKEGSAKQLVQLRKRFDALLCDTPVPSEEPTEKAALKCIECIGSQWYAEFSNGKVKKITLKNCSLDTLTTDSITNKLIHVNEEHQIFEIKKKGYGVYRIKLNSPS